ncbi:hypothetical protein ISS30_11270 [bacterium]|nr:hypothetical protein [FCB group bacterium]MBL7192259.1 hypothetical protein [bacterium]
MAVNFGFWMAEGMRGFFLHRFTAVIALLGLSLSLWLFSFQYLLWNNLERFRGTLLEGFKLQLFLEPSITEEQRLTIDSILANHPDIGRIEYISPEKAAEIFAAEFGEEIFEVVEENPLPPSYELTLNPGGSAGSAASRVKKDIEGIPSVDEVIYQGDVLTVFEAKYKSLTWAFITAGSFILVISLIIFIHGMKVSIMGRRRLVNALLLTGAKYSTVRLPFIFEGILTGTASGLLAYIGVRFIHFIIDKLLFPLPCTGPLYLVIPAGTILGLLSAILQVSKYLKGFLLDNKGRIY